MNRRILLLCLLIGSTITSAYADVITHLQDQWAVCQYQSSSKAACFGNLNQAADSAIAEAPERADLLIWSAIIKSSMAKEDGGINALILAKEARRELENAIQLQPNALQGSAYTTLGTLYYQVPSWPVSFGNKTLAEKMLKQALEINPDGIDSNFFYGDFLLKEGRKEEAKQYLAKALTASSKAGTNLANKGRKQVIQLLLSS